jgi:hypothetical protein
MDFNEKEIEVRNTVVNTNNSVNNNDVYEELILRQLERISGQGNYRVYTALLTQYGTNAPTATVLENTLGFVPVFNYISTGIYSLSNTEFSLTNKISTFINCGNVVYNSAYSAKINKTNEEGIIYISSFNAGVLANDVLSDGDNFFFTTIEIRIYK